VGTGELIRENKEKIGRAIWEQELATIPIDEDGNIDRPFFHFKKGEDKKAVWDWFEKTFNVRVFDLINRRART